MVCMSWNQPPISVPFKFEYPGFLGCTKSLEVTATIWCYQLPPAIQDNPTRLLLQGSIARLPVPSSLTKDNMEQLHPPPTSAPNDGATAETKEDAAEKQRFLKAWPCSHLFT